MLQQLFQVWLEKVPNSVELKHPLHVALEEEYFSKFNMVKDDQLIHTSFKEGHFYGVLMRDYFSVYESSENVFVHVNIVSTAATKANKVIIYVSEYFLNRYKYRYGDKCYFKFVYCYPLEKVVVGVKTKESYDYFTNPNKKLCKELHSSNVLCRRNDELIIPSCSSQDSVILDSQPMCQGTLTLNSSLIIADMQDSLDHDSNSVATADMQDKMNCDSSSVISPDTEFEINVRPKLDTPFQRELVEKEMDEHSTVFISKTAMSELKLVNGSWVEIELFERVLNEKSNAFEKKHIKSRFVRVCSFSDESFPNNRLVYLFPLLWFNLNKHPSALMQPHLRLQIKCLKKPMTPFFAKSAHACLVQSSNYDGKVHSHCDAMLKKYFDTPRFFQKGDIFAVNSKNQFDFALSIQDEELDKMKWPVIYFRITHIEGSESPFKGYVISNGYSKLYHAGTKQAYIPATMETYYSPYPDHPIYDSISEGLGRYVTLLQNLILPFLKLQKENWKISSNILLSGPPCCGKTTVVKAICKCLNLHLYQVNCHELIGETAATTEAKIRNKLTRASTYTPCVVLFKNIHLIGKEKDPGSEDSRVLTSFATSLKEVNANSGINPIVVIGTTTESKAPDEWERATLLQELLSVCDVSNDVSTLYLAQRTAGFVLGDLSSLVKQAIRNAYSRIRKLIIEKNIDIRKEEDLVLAAVPVAQKDLLHALEKLQAEFADAIGAPKIPNVQFDDVGGLAYVKQEILDTIQLPLEHPEILASGLRRSGVLLYGPPGSGKTLLAKAVATECSLNFLSVKGPELINMYVGQSEENVRAVFNQARSAVPCIIFFDELDSLAPNRGRSGDSGGVMDRVVSQLLAELDGLNKKSEVFVIGATNRPDLLDPALLRPGRFDRLLYVGIPEDKRSKMSILKALTRKIPLAKDVSLEKVIEKCPKYLSGADFYSLCSNAVIKRVEKNVEQLEKGETTIEELSSAIRTEDFLSALENLVPSVTPEQYEEYLQIKSRMENKSSDYSKSQTENAIPAS
ncbi:peroxisome assembly factor 2-like isoform X2 [Stegodyphus dumicola]|uniref:peroxisome assembly factor 2-like isoform X2 n=1 Tax=Stegodyphus dumicola TaxID=202533 RepID=UPI0015B307F9|nr:peroxisome assembly factor 2-like isoform X2 [Stegodyphus dumicola]